MIEIKYKQLFVIELLHNFYSSGKSGDFVLEPTLKCQAILKNFGLRFLPTQTGGTLFAKVNVVGGESITSKPLTEGTNFTFLLRLKNPLFENFTSLDLNKPKSHHYYFNNLVNNPSDAGFPLLVSDTGSKVVSSTDYMPFAGNSFSFVNSSVDTEQHGELQFIDSGETFTQTLQNHNNTFNFSYDLLKSQGGRAKFFVEGVERKMIYVTDGADGADVFGVIDIFYKSSLPAAYQFQLPDNAVVTKLYAIQFAARSTKWRYVITKKFNQAVSGVTVAKSNGTSIDFSPLNGAPAGQFIMVSDTSLPLREVPLTGIKLSDQLNKPLITNLPNPSSGMISQEGTTIFSDILITI